MKIKSSDRNGSATFAERVLKNLNFIADAAKKEQDVHPVTQAVSSLLGIIVFPWEVRAFEVVGQKSLTELVRNRGWPKWECGLSDNGETLGNFVRRLRNCVAHGQVTFDSDSRDPVDVNVTFTHYDDGTGTVNWIGRIRGDRLTTFCRCFVEEIREAVA